MAALLADLLATEGIKVIVFSQWVRMHELLAERIEAAGFGHVFLHGGVPSAERGALVRRFRDDPACRVFLSTDAGGTGLNLQAASVVVNVDQPWNPAVLEQRIGRVHRLGQSRPVEVFDFVAEDSIEQGMLGLLGFKRALFTGLLDGGEPEVLLRGTRLSRFMETVGTVAETIPVPPRAEAAPAAPADEVPRPAAAPDAPVALPAGPVEGPRSPSGPPAGAALAGLLRAGASLLGQLAAAADEGARGGAGEPGVRFERDEATGKTVLRVEVPDPEALLEALRALLKAPDAAGSGDR
ncbi:MAG: SWF/SNF helicase family protein [Thermoanaerobaculia bacterium]|nr:SWF/SNF helicase family protein [Thermoanaerobaculia bacterium]